MKKYIKNRILSTIPLFFAITFLCFVLINFIPSDPAEVALRVNQVTVISEELLQSTKEQLGLNDPFMVRYFKWLFNCFRLDFGVSYVNPTRTVLSEFLRSMPNTIKLATSSFVLVISISIPIGFLCAVYKDRWFDRVMRGFIFITTAMPSYWIGLILIWIVSIKLNLLPTSGIREGIKSLILPSITVALTYISTFIRLIRANMIENMGNEYVLYGKVRGLKERTILVKHVLKNSLHTCLTAIGMVIPQLIAGTIVVENLFAIPGLGNLCIDAIYNRDYPIIQTYVLFIGVLFLIFNLTFDIIQCALDPKLRKESN